MLHLDRLKEQTVWTCISVMYEASMLVEIEVIANVELVQIKSRKLIFK